MKKVLLAGLVFGLVGCAAPNKPEMSNDQANIFARGVAQLFRCGEANQLTSEEVVLGEKLIVLEASRYIYDSAALDRLLNQHYVHQSSVDPAMCQTHSLEIARHKYKLNTVNSVPSQSAPINTIRNTYCNRIGYQTMCTSF